MRYIELFAGIGGMGYGLMQAGMQCVGYCEIDKYAHKAFQILHDPEERMWEAYDVRSVTDEHLRLLRRERGPIDLIAAGFPCQSFSIAGKRQGFADATRGTLFFEIIRFASILKPNYLLFENVDGLLSHDEGRTFGIIISTLDEMGYDLQWEVLNSDTYVPQNRERIFIVGHSRGRSRPEIFPLGKENSNSVKVVGRIDINADDYCKRVYSTDGLAPCLPTMQGGSQEPKILVNINEGKLRIRNDFTCLDANYAKGLDNHGARTGVLQLARGKNKGGIHKIAPTLTSNSYEHNNFVFGEWGIRKLTPLECFRLQSFPDEWYYKLKQHGISDSQLYKMAGNAVTSRVAYEIGIRIMKGA